MLPAIHRRLIFAALAAALTMAALIWSDRSIANENQPPHPQLSSFPVQIGGPFTLIDEDGRRRANGDFHGRFMLMFFGYTHCPDICGTGLAEMAAVMDALGSDAERVQPLFITVDPTRDRPRDLKAFTAQFHPRLVGLTGTEAEIKTVAKLYRIHRRKVLIPGEPEADYLAMHTALIYLIGPNGAFDALFPLGTPPEVIARAISRKPAKN